MTSKEEFYDAEIAPKLLEIGKLCEKNGLSMCAVVEYDAGESYGETTTLAKDSSFAMRLIKTAVDSHGNIDALMFAVARYAQSKGIQHNSLVLSNMLRPKEEEIKN